MSKPSKAAKPAPKSGVSKSTILWIVAAAIVVVIIALLMRPVSSATPGGAASNPGGSAASAGTVVVVDTAKVQELAKQGVPIIDVRTPAEYAGGHIPGAQNIPVDSVPTAMQNWDRTTSLVVYCQSGSRSAQAVADLQQMGWKGTIYHLAQGFSTWTGPVEQGANAAATQPAPAKLPATKLPVMYEFYSDG